MLYNEDDAYLDSCARTRTCPSASDYQKYMKKVRRDRKESQRILLDKINNLHNTDVGYLSECKLTNKTPSASGYQEFLQMLKEEELEYEGDPWDCEQDDFFPGEYRHY